MSFQLVPKSVTLNDLERRYGRYSCVISPNSVASGANCAKVVEDVVVKKFTFTFSSDEFHVCLRHLQYTYIMATGRRCMLDVNNKTSPYTVVIISVIVLRLRRLTAVTQETRSRRPQVREETRADIKGRKLSERSISDDRRPSFSHPTGNGIVR